MSKSLYCKVFKMLTIGESENDLKTKKVPFASSSYNGDAH